MEEETSGTERERKMVTVAGVSEFRAFGRMVALRLEIIISLVLQSRRSSSSSRETERKEKEMDGQIQSQRLSLALSNKKVDSLADVRTRNTRILASLSFSRLLNSP